MVGEKLKSVFDEHSGANFEYFPVTILDKKGRPDKRPYYVANLLDTVDCVDMEKSSYVMDSIIKDQVMYFKELILDESKIPEDKAIFRLKDKTDLIIINDPLSDAILDAGCTGIDFQYWMTMVLFTEIIKKSPIQSSTFCRGFSHNIKVKK